MPPNARCGLGPRRMLKRNGFSNKIVEVGRPIEQRQSLAFPNLHPRQFGIGDRRALKRSYRGGPPMRPANFAVGIDSLR